MQRDGSLCRANSRYETRNGRAYDRHNNVAGPLIGAIIGGVVGNQIGSGSGRAAATGVGAIAGGAIGNSIQNHNRNARECVYPSAGRAERMRYEQCLDRYMDRSWNGNSSQTWRRAQQACRTNW